MAALKPPENMLELFCTGCNTIFETNVGTVFLENDFFNGMRRNKNASNQFIRTLRNLKGMREHISFAKDVVCPKCKSVNAYQLTRSFTRFLMLEFMKDGYFHGMGAPNLIDIAESQISKNWNIPSLVISHFTATIDGTQTKISPIDAEKYYRRKIDADKNNPVLHERRANLLRSMFRYEEAIDGYKKALELDSQMDGSYYNLGLIYVLNNDLDKAEEMFLEMQKTADLPDDEETREIIRKNSGLCLKIVAGLKKKRGLLTIPYIDNKVVFKAANDIFEMIEKRFPDLIEEASDKFSEESYISEPDVTAEKAVINAEFLYWLATNFELKNGMSPSEYYLEKKYKTLPYEERLAVESLIDSKRDFFEVEKADGKNYVICSIFNRRKYDVMTYDMHPLPVGTEIAARLLPIGTNRYSFIGMVRVFGEGVHVKDAAEKDIAKKLKIADRHKELFIEYFKSTDTEFQNMKSLERALKEYVSFIRLKLGGHSEEGADKVDDVVRIDYKDCDSRSPAGKNKRVGLVFSRWINIIPFYGYIKDIFGGRQSDVPEYEDLLSAIVKDGQFINGPILKKLAEENKETCVSAFKGLFSWIETFDDVLSVLRIYRDDLDEQEVPQISLVKDYGTIEKLIDDGNVSDALEKIEEIVKEENDDLELLLLKSECLMNKGSFDEALKALDDCESLAPESPVVQYRKANVNFFKLKFFDALDEINKSIKADPDNFDYVMMKAAVLHQIGRREYMQWINKARRIDKERADEFMKTHWITERLLI